MQGASAGGRDERVYFIAVDEQAMVANAHEAARQRATNQGFEEPVVTDMQGVTAVASGAVAVAKTHIVFIARK